MAPIIQLSLPKVLEFSDQVNDGRGNISITATAPDGFSFRICNYWTGYGFKGWIVDQNKYTPERRPYFDDLETAKLSMETRARAYYEDQIERNSQALSRLLGVLGYKQMMIKAQ